jgi:hypothetical protein
MAAYESGIADNIDVDAEITKIYIADHIGIHMNYIPVHITVIRCHTNALVDYLPLNIDYVGYYRITTLSNHCTMKLYNLPPFIYRLLVYDDAISISANTKHHIINTYNWTNMANSLTYAEHKSSIYNVATRMTDVYYELYIRNIILIDISY